MKVDRLKLKKSSVVPPECKQLIESLRSCSEAELLPYLKKCEYWSYGKCELFHWVDVLDLFDEVLHKACIHVSENIWTMACDLPCNEQLKLLLLEVVRFTEILIEHSFSRHLYNSMEHLISLLASGDMAIVLAVLNLLYVFSKRSNFISRMIGDKKAQLIAFLRHVAESWGGRENGFGLAEFCRDLPLSSYPSTATTLHFEFYPEKDNRQHSARNPVQCIHIKNVHLYDKLPSQIMDDLLLRFNIPLHQQMLLFTHIRLACLFPKHAARLQCVQARLQALSILVYANAIHDFLSILIYPGLVEELVDIIDNVDQKLVDIKSATIRTLISIIHIDRNPKLVAIIDATGAASYHGFLPVLVRTCIQRMIDPEIDAFPQQYATALFSFLYHMASYEHGMEALVSCGMMEVLLKVTNWYLEGQDNITFVTRAVRVIDLITNMDMSSFHSLGGMPIFTNRIEHEVKLCRGDQPFVIRPQYCLQGVDSNPDSPLVAMESEAAQVGEKCEDPELPSMSKISASIKCQPSTRKQCIPQRAALLKSLLNFMKKAIPDVTFTDSIRHIMDDGLLPNSLKHIISNAEYYGPSLFLLATDIVTVYVFQEPSLLSSLQEKGLTDVVLHALLVKDVPATREVLASLPTVFSALCLNTRGLEAFVACHPFDRLFKVLLSPVYLPAMRRRRNADPFGDTASNLGNAMDELMRHQPSLRTDATKAIIKLLEEICSMGKDSTIICQKQQPKPDQSSASPRSPQHDGGSSDEEDEEEDQISTENNPCSDIQGDVSTSASNAGAKLSNQDSTAQHRSMTERNPVPLMEYVLNVMKFVEAILSNNSTDDHCREFINQNGLLPLMEIFGLANLPIDFPGSLACQSIASVGNSVLTLSREPDVLKQCLSHLNVILGKLEPLHMPLSYPGGSVLLHELASVVSEQDAALSSVTTPLLHSLSATHAYITMLIHICRMGQNDIRTMCMCRWGSDLGLSVLQGLSRLYTSLVWESTVLLALCSADILPPLCPFGRADMDRIIPAAVRDLQLKQSTAACCEDLPANEQDGGPPSNGSNGVSAAMESLTTECVGSPMETGEAMGCSVTTHGGVTRRDHSDVTGLCLPVERDLLSGCSAAVWHDAGGSVSAPSSGPSTAPGIDLLCGKRANVSPVLQAQIKQLKPLLSVSSKLGHALAELFGLLVKLCVGLPVRQRRSQAQLNQIVAPVAAVPTVASALSDLLSNGLSLDGPAYAAVPRLRLTFLVCSVGFTSPMLFDEKKQPYHLMLSKFVKCGGQAALFQAFSWVLSIDGKVALCDGLENLDLPDGSGEFLDSWLLLVEKMVNPRMLLDSPHTIPVKLKATQRVTFCPVQYLISTHKVAFNAVMNLWNKKPLKMYGARMTESLLNIMCHIIRGEGIIKEQLSRKEGKTAVAPEAGPSDTSGQRYGRQQETDVNQLFMQQLMDMGFSLDQAIDALMNASSLEQATDYILSHAPLLSSSSGASRVLGMDVDLSDEEQMMRAIALSLGEAEKPQADETQEKKCNDDEKEVKEEPLDKSVLDDFTSAMLQGCLGFLDTMPESVYRVCDLICVIAQRNGSVWHDQTMVTVVKEVHQLAERTLSFNNGDDDDVSHLRGVAKRLSESDECLQFGVRLHLLILMLEATSVPCAEAIQNAHLPELLVRVLDFSVNILQKCRLSRAAMPKWLSPLMLILDSVEKVTIISQRKAEAVKCRAGSSTWKWFDDSTGRWCKYSIGNNKTMHDAYMAALPSVRFQAGRRKYCIQFNTMVQLNEETGNRRPVMLSFPTAEDKSSVLKEKPTSVFGLSIESGANHEVEKSDVLPLPAEESKMEIEISQVEKDSDIICEASLATTVGLDTYVTGIISSLVKLISVLVDPDTLHALMRLLLRLTRHHQHALFFAELGGPRAILNLTQAAAFQGFLSLTTLLFRHVMDDANALEHCMEKVTRHACVGIGSNACGVGDGSVGSKEMHFMMRVLGPAACRSVDLFTKVARDRLEISLPLQSKIVKDEDEVRVTGPNAPQILKFSGTKIADTTLLTPVKECLCNLITALIAVYKPTFIEAKGLEANLRHMLSNQSAVGVTFAQRSCPSLLPTSGTETGCDEDSSGMAAPSGKICLEQLSATSDDDLVSRPLFNKSDILRMLAEIVKSYRISTVLITQYNFSVSDADIIGQPSTLLAFILDRLLPPCQTDGDKDCPALARVFLASLAACCHCTETQLILVSEIKLALQRALMLTDSVEKHLRIQAITSIICTVIDACPNTSANVVGSVFMIYQSQNAMVKHFIRKGIVTDIARITNHIDLSSSHVPATINAALKPLEILSRAVNCPTVYKKKGDNDDAASNVQEEASVSQHSTSSNLDSCVQSLIRTIGDVPELDRQQEDGITIVDVTDSIAQQASLDGSPAQNAVESDGASQSQQEEADLGDIVSRLFSTDRRPRRGVRQQRDAISEPEESQDESIEVLEADVVELDRRRSRLARRDASDDDNIGSRHRRHSAGADNILEESPDSPSETEDDYHELDQDDDADDEEDDDDDDDDEVSDMEGDGDDYQVEDNSVAPTYADVDVPFHFEEVQFGSSGGNIFLTDNSSQFCSYQPLPGLSDVDTGTDATVFSVPPAPPAVTPIHPLLTRQSEPIGNNRAVRSRTRVPYRFTPSAQTFHMNMTGTGATHGHAAMVVHSSGNSSTIFMDNVLESLLGPGAAADLLQLTQSFPQDTYNDTVGTRASCPLSCIPSTLSRWMEEARVLDGDSVHDLVAVVKPDIIAELVRKRDSVLGEWRGKRHQLASKNAADAIVSSSSELSSVVTTTVTAGVEVGISELCDSQPNSGVDSSTPTSSNTGQTDSQADTSELSSMSLVTALPHHSLLASASYTCVPGTASPAVGISQLASQMSGHVSTLNFTAAGLDAFTGAHPSSVPPSSISLTPEQSAPASVMLISDNSRQPYCNSPIWAPLPPPVFRASGISQAITPQMVSMTFAGQHSHVHSPMIFVSITAGPQANMMPMQQPHEMMRATSMMPRVSFLPQTLRHDQPPPVLQAPLMIVPVSSIMPRPIVTMPTMPQASIPSGVPAPGINMPYQEQLMPTFMPVGAVGNPMLHTGLDGVHFPPMRPQFNQAVRAPLFSPMMSSVQHSTQTPFLVNVPATNLQISIPVCSHVTLRPPILRMSQPSAFDRQGPVMQGPHFTPWLPTGFVVQRFNPGDDQNLPLLQYQPQFLTQQANMPNTHLPFHPPQPPYLPQMYSQPPNTSMMHVPTGLFSSPPPILNLQEFISVFTPGSDSPSFSYPNGIMSRDATAADNNAAVTAGSVGHEVVNDSAPGCSVAIGVNMVRDCAPSAAGQLSSSVPITTTLVIVTSVTTAVTTRWTDGAVPAPESSVASSAQALGSSVPATIGDVPDGVDPSFLAALPENIRQEVIADQLRMQRIQACAQVQAADGSGALEVNPEFLAALPANIQEEVLNQQRMAQAQQLVIREGDVDPANFIDSLPPQLRLQVLSDMDDTTMSVLPPQVAAEARELRQELEDRHHRMMQDRMFFQGGVASLSSILRNPGVYSHLGGSRYAVRASGLPALSRQQWTFGMANQQGGNGTRAVATMRMKGRHLLDHEALTCLLVLLFVNDSKINTSRLFRVLQNLCHHAPTRSWILSALISILHRSSEQPEPEDDVGNVSGVPTETMIAEPACGNSSQHEIDTAPCAVAAPVDKSNSVDGWLQAEANRFPRSWLSMSMDTALGSRANVFIVPHGSGCKRLASGSLQGTNVYIHPHATPVVCRHVLETFISLAKVFPSHFLPILSADDAMCNESKNERDADPAVAAQPQPSVSYSRNQWCGTSGSRVHRAEKALCSNSPFDVGRQESDFWSNLLKLSGSGSVRKGKLVQKAHSSSSCGTSECSNAEDGFRGSIFGHLMGMLNHPVMHRSQSLMDRLLRLLSLISGGIQHSASVAGVASSLHPTSTVSSTVTSSSIPSTSLLTVSAAPVMVTPEVVDSVLGVEVIAEDENLSETTDRGKLVNEGTVGQSDEVILVKELDMAVQVLTSKLCSEEGLDDGTSLLLQVSWANQATRHAILNLLMEGAHSLGITVKNHILCLLNELVELNSHLVDDRDVFKENDVAVNQSAKGVILDRFSPSGSAVVVMAPAKAKKVSRELQLPSMSKLTNKTSSQRFFLRLLKVITQLRLAARSAFSDKAAGTSVPGSDNAHRPCAPPSDAADNSSELLMQSVQETIASSQDGQAVHSQGAVASQGSAVVAQDSSGVAMETDQEHSSGGAVSDKEIPANPSSPLPRLSVELQLDDLWVTLSDCLMELSRTPDHHAVLILQPAVEAFFIIHAGEKDVRDEGQLASKREDQLAHLNMDMAPPSPAVMSADAGPQAPSLSGQSSNVVDRSVSRDGSASSLPSLPPDTCKFLKFAEMHRTVLNQILRQSTLPLSEGPFSVLVDHTRMLDFDVKRRYFRQELDRSEERLRRDDLPVHVRRGHVFEDSFRELFRRAPDEWKQRFYIVFEGEEGQDAGGLLREWYLIISREIFNPNYALFQISPGDRVTYTISPSSHCNSNHLSYFKFVGRIIAKAIYDNKLLECYFTRSFYKHVLGQSVRYQDMESEDYTFYQSLTFILENNVDDIGSELYFSTEVQEFGVTSTRELKADGGSVRVTEENKREYVTRLCQEKMVGSIRQQLHAFLEGFYDIIPKSLVSIFTEQELELLISGLPTIDVDDLKMNTEYHKYQSSSLQIQWFWRALRSMVQAERANFLQFVTGTSKVPLQGFAHLEGMNGVQKFQIHRDDRSTDRLPSAHTCFNQLDLPAYETYDKLRKMLLLAISECSEGFGLA